MSSNTQSNRRGKLFVIWVIVLLTGLALFSFAPGVFEPFLCNEYETITHLTREIEDSSGKSWSTDLYCVDLEGQARPVGEQVGVPFVLIIVVLPFVILRLNRPEQADNVSETDA